MANQYVNKVIIGKEVKLDLTADSVTPDKLAKGITAHDKTGAPITGTSTKDVDSTDATVAVAEMLEGKTAYARGAKLTGTMPNNGAVAGKITQKDGKYTIPMGFHDGSGSAAIDETEQAKLVPANIREGVTILGVEGSMSSSEGMKPQAKSVAPTFEQQTVYPSKKISVAPTLTANSMFLSLGSTNKTGVFATDVILADSMDKINAGLVYTGAGTITALVEEKPSSDVVMNWWLRT